MPLRLLALSLQTAISPGCASQSKLLDRQIAACGAGGEHAAALVINPYQDAPDYCDGAAPTMIPRRCPAAMSCAMPAARRLPTVTDDEARRIAANIAKLPALLTREE